MCDTMVVVEPGRVLFAKNSDRDPNESQLLEWHPRRSHAGDARVTCTWLTIPQVRETAAVLLSRPFWMWGAEMGANEHGVVIGNEAVFTDQPYAGTGLTGMDLLRLALERSATADEAVATITGLLATHGQGGGCGHEDRSFTYHNSFLVADHRHAYVLETAGRLWEVEQVTAGVRTISNGLTLPGLRGHADRVRTRVSRCALRRQRTTALAAGATSPSDLMAVLRDHGAGNVGPDYDVLTGAMSAPCMHAGGLVASSQTTASWVAALTPDGARHWATGTAAPCTSLFVPVRVDEPVDHGAAPTDVFDPGTWWWRHELLHRQVARDPAALLPTFAAERDAVERRWVDDPPPSTDAFAEADRLVRRWTAAVAARPTRDRRPWPVRRYWAARNERAGMPADRATVTASAGSPGR